MGIWGIIGILIGIPIGTFGNFHQIYSNCPLIENGGKPDLCPDGDCNCFEEDGTGCMFGFCVCLHKAHLVFNHMKCNDVQHLNHYENDTESENTCPRMCKANDENNTCMPPTVKDPNTGRCHCRDGTPIVPFITKQLTLDTATTLKQCGNSPLPQPTTTPLQPQSISTSSSSVSICQNNQCDRYFLISYRIRHL